jgi:hypothetical protein
MRFDVVPETQIPIRILSMAHICWKVNIDSREVNVVLKWLEWLKIQTGAGGHRSAYIYPVVL